MKKMHFKTLVLLLLAFATVLTFASCTTAGNNGTVTVTEGKNDESKTVTDAVTEKETETDEWGRVVVDSNLPTDLDFGGATVDICIRSGEQYRREWNKDKIEDSLDNEIFNRNTEVEEELGIQFHFIVTDEGTNCETINAAIANSAKSGLGDIDITSNYAAYASNPNLMQYYTNFLDSSRLIYLELDKPWWNQNFRNAAEAYGKLFLMVGDVNLSVYDRTIVTFFNQNLCEDYDILTSALYRDVSEGKWTFEKLYNYTKDVYDDRNQNETKDDADFFGLTSIKGSEATDGFIYSFDCYLTEINNDGDHELVSGKTMLDKMDTAMTKIQQLFAANGAMACSNSAVNYKVFTESRALFDIDVIYHYAAGNKMMRDMTDKYGMIPVPKYDEEQKEYKSGVQDAHNVMSIVYHPKQNYALMSAVLELLCYKTYQNVRPYYFEKMVKTKYLRDDISGQIFDMLLESTTWDFADIYTCNLDYPRNRLWRGAFSSSQSVTVRYETYEEQIGAAYAEFDTWLRTHY